MFLFLLFSVLLLCSFFKLKELFQVKNGVTTSLLFFFFENAKNWGRSDDAKRRKKKEDGLIEGKETRLNHYKIHSILLLSVKLSQLLYSFLKWKAESNLYVKFTMGWVILVPHDTCAKFCFFQSRSKMCHRNSSLFCIGKRKEKLPRQLFSDSSD